MMHAAKESSFRHRGELLHETIARLVEAYDHDPSAVERKVDRAVKLLVLLRDKLILEGRHKDLDDPVHASAALRDVNAALSLIVGVDFPAAGIKRDLMKKAEQLLKGLDTDPFTKM